MPVLAQRAFEAERQRQLPSETVTDLREPGLLLAGRPERFGGHAVDFDTLMEIAAILGEGCGSTAWCYSVWVNHNWLVGLYDDVAQREFFGSGPDVLASSAFDPMAGQVAPADGGYMLHGRWRFSSGADAASWALLGGVTPDQGPGLFLVPRACYHVVDTWFVSGLAGTGSKDVVIDAPVFVPATHFASYAAAGAAATPGRQLCDRPSYRIPMYTILPWTLVAPLVGVGQAAIGAFQAQCRERLARVAGGWDPQPAQARLAESSAAVDCARLLMRDHLEAAISRGVTGEAFTLEERARYRRDMCFAARLTVSAVTRLSRPAAATRSSRTSRCSATSATCMPGRTRWPSPGTRRPSPTAGSSSGWSRATTCSEQEALMKIVVFGADRRVGALQDGQVIDLNAADELLPSDLRRFIAAGPAALELSAETLERVRGGGREGVVQPVGSVRLHAPWASRARIACAGGNCAEHLAGAQAAISGRSVTAEEVHRESRAAGPWGFFKVLDHVAGPEEEVTYPARATRFDYEGEVAVVIGRPARDVVAERAADVIWGVTLLNDWSIRNDMGQPRILSFNLAKNFDGSASLGPAIVVGELDPQDVALEVRVNGELRQSFRSRDMIFSFAEYLEHLTRDFTFQPGDVLAGGTGPGTAMDTSRPDRFLSSGDVVEVSSPAVGVLRNRIVGKRS